MSSKAKKIVEECANEQNKTLDLVDRGIANIIDIPGLCKLKKSKSNHHLLFVIFFTI